MKYEFKKFKPYIKNLEIHYTFNKITVWKQNLYLKNRKWYFVISFKN